MRARRPRQEEEGGSQSPSWLITYSDMVTLLLTFFVMLMAMANFEDVTRLNAVLESIRMALSMGSLNTNVAQDDDLSSPWTSDPSQRDNIQPIVARLRESLAEHISDDLVRMTQTREEIRVEIDDRLLFEAGSTSIHPSALGIIGDLGRILAAGPAMIAAEGHTDASGDPIRNWELSTLRAVAVVTSLERHGPIPGERLEARGFGSNRPRTSDDSEPHWNRRVELVIQSDDRGAYSALQEIMNVQRAAGTR